MPRYLPSFWLVQNQSGSRSHKLPRMTIIAQLLTPFFSLLPHVFKPLSYVILSFKRRIFFHEFFGGEKRLFNLKNLLHSQLSIVNGQMFELRSKGMSSVYIIIFIAITAFAIMLSGGSGSLFSGNMPSSIIDTPTPAISSIIPSTATSPSPSSSSGWNVKVILGSCAQNKLTGIEGTVIVSGPENGYIMLSVDNPVKIIDTQSFTKPYGEYKFTLSNVDNFNNSTWKYTVFSGGGLVAGQWTGGTQTATYNGAPTGC